MLKTSHYILNLNPSEFSHDYLSTTIASSFSFNCLDIQLLVNISYYNKYIYASDEFELKFPEPSWEGCKLSRAWASQFSN